MKRYGVLDRVSHPSDLRTMPYAVLQELCGSMREFLVDHVSQTGGHLSSNLGIVELSVALERVFDSGRDRIIYDVGHQSYVHKILTGRKEQFDTLRQYGGLSGFQKPDESPCDPCITGHASSSVSVALGMAHARTLKGQKYHVVAVIGDGALTGGMAYEALNNAGGSGEPLIVVLNDNNMSIAKNVGAMNRHLAKLRVSPRYLKAKQNTKEFLNRNEVGRHVESGISHTKRRLRSVVLPDTLFEQMGFSYLGPVDGHDLKSLCEALEVVKGMKKPVLLHVMTQKGRGYRFSEANPEVYHGVSAFDPLIGIQPKEGSISFSSAFGDALCGFAQSDERICAITAAMPTGTGLMQFARQFPKRFFDVGIAEEHAVAMAAGMAQQGLRPVCAIYSTFLQRAFDQLIHDASIAGNVNLILAIDRAGIVGADGATHNGVFDVAYLRMIPGLALFAPSNYAEMQSMLSQALYKREGVVALRYARGGQGAFQQNTSAETGVFLREGSDAVLVSYGVLINHALEAAESLAQQEIQTAVYKINELTAPPQPDLLEAIAKAGRLIVAEDVVETGGMGQMLAGTLAMAGISVRACVLRNTGDRFLPQGSVQKIEQLCALDQKGLEQAVLEAMEY